jgi:hypothetical protein
MDARAPQGVCHGLLELVSCRQSIARSALREQPHVERYLGELTHLPGTLREQVVVVAGGDFKGACLLISHRAIAEDLARVGVVDSLAPVRLGGVEYLGGGDEERPYATLSVLAQRTHGAHLERFVHRTCETVL